MPALAYNDALALANRAQNGDMRALAKLARALLNGAGYLTYAGSPVSNVTPTVIGQVLFDTTNSVFYKAVGLTSSDWHMQSAANSDTLVGVTAGAVLASKAAIVDSNKDIADFRNLSGTNLKAGKDAVAGSLTVFPATTARGSTTITASDNAGATTTNINTAAQSGARTYTVPDAGASASFAMTEGNQTINGVKTFGSPPVMSGASITAGTIPNTALAANGGLASVIGAGLGASHSYLKTQNTAATLLAGAVGDRSVLIVVVVDETFANVGGAQSTFTIGQTGTANKFADTTAFTNKTAGTVLTFAGTLTGTDNLIVTGAAATVTGTGGITVTVIALPV